MNTSRSWGTRVLSVADKNNSRVCCGLDPDLRKMPRDLIASFPNPEDAVRRFLIEIVDSTHSHVCAYKIQKAFFEPLHDGGSLIREVVAHIHTLASDMPVILDCKIGDIENTMDCYLDSYFTDLGVDAVVLNPYMGTDVWRGLAAYPDKAGLVLVRTSNRGADCVQDIVTASGNPLWQSVLEIVLGEWRDGTNLIPILSSNTRVDDATAATIMSASTPVFIAGIGAQGGDLTNVASLLKPSVPIMFNSSRAILYPPDTSERHWQQSVVNAAMTLRNTINERLQ